MKTAPQEMLKEYVRSQYFTSTAEIMTAMKEMFRDVVQTVMEVELDFVTLCKAKIERFQDGVLTGEGSFFGFVKFYQ